jgi:hypothetical protein
VYDNQVYEKNGCFPFVNTIIIQLHCVYLMQRFHHMLLDMCKYLMMQSSTRQMIHTRTSEELNLDILEGSTGRGRGQVPHGNAPPPPPPPRSPLSLEQLLAT